MVDQPTSARMMNVLSRGSYFVQGREPLIFEHTLEQCPEMRISEIRDDASQFSKHLVWIAIGAGKVIGEIDFVLLQAAQTVNSKLMPILMNLQNAFNLDEVVPIEGVHHLSDVVPHLRLDLPRSVGEMKRQKWLTSSLLADFF